MLITVTCDKCHKQYKVDSKLGGKKAKCKSCGNAISIPVADAPDVTADLMAGLTAAAAAEHPTPMAPAATAPAQATPKREAIAPPPPEPANPVAGAESAADGDEMALAEPPCPRCGLRFVAGARYCASCGYDRRPEPASALPAAAAPAPAVLRRQRATVVAGDDDRDDKGYRRNRPYEGGIAEWLDSVSLMLGQVIFWFLVLVAVLGTFKNLADVAKARSDHPNLTAWAYLIALVIYPIALGLWVGLIVPGAYLGLKLAGMVMKFHMPDEPRWRIITTQLGSMVYFIVGWFLAAFYFWLVQRASFSDAISEASYYASIIFVVTIVLALPTHFLLTWLLLRVRFVEALVAWLFEGIAVMIAWTVLIVIVMLLTAVMARIMMGPA